MLGQVQAQSRARTQVRRRAYPEPVSAFEAASLILGRPSGTSCALAVTARRDLEGRAAWGPPDSQGTWQGSEVFTLKKGESVTLELKGLQPNSVCEYRLEYRDPDAAGFQMGPVASFQTSRSSGQPFSFIVQGDSHPERTPKMHVPELYEKTLLMAASQKPDFFICMGDDFSVDTLATRTKESAEGVYRRQVPYLSLIGSSSPLFLVNGNHEQAAKVNLNGTQDSLGVMTQTARNHFFPQPAPDSFYSGNSEPVEHIGLLRNYFSWTWGDALFVVIDPYWHSDGPVDNSADRTKPRRDLWNNTLGETQYQWLKRVLETSREKFKFVFAHHVNGTGRGGVECAPFYEWGGRDQRGAYVFETKRPGWELPIHQLMAKNRVSIFFQGHDHLFCRQELDGVIYQTTPTPADASGALLNGDAYKTGVKLPGAGILKVTISGQEAKVDFLRSLLPSAETESARHGSSAYSYTLTAR